MDIQVQSSSIKITFPEECENFAAGDALQALEELKTDSKAVEIDLSKVKSMDTVFINILVSLINTLKGNGNKYEIISKSEEAKRVLSLYGLKL
jgi:ABC-type transporter Mla MlaB component